MPTLHLGVTEVAYSEAAPKGKRKRRKSAATITTGEVAEILEDEYHPIEHYWELHKEEIAKSLEGSLAGALETAMMTGSLPENAFASAESEIEAGFKKMLSERELEGLGYPGLPTQAALKGVSHRLKHPYAKSNPRRPSLIDTGLYQASFKSWFEG
jgi:hypothetical protein